MDICRGRWEPEFISTCNVRGSVRLGQRSDGCKIYAERAAGQDAREEGRVEGVVG